MRRLILEIRPRANKNTCKAGTNPLPSSITMAPAGTLAAISAEFFFRSSIS